MVPSTATANAMYRAGGTARQPRSFMKARETWTASHGKPGARSGRSVASRKRCSVKHGVGGFTLVELLVTIGVIAVLAGLLVSSLRYGKFRAKVTQCSNNMRQIAIACQLHAADGQRGLLPSYMLPTGSGGSTGLMGYHAVEPWFVAFEMITNVEKYGVGPSMWYCPTRHKWDTINEVYKWKTGKTIGTGADLVANYQLVSPAPMVGVDMFWWVPRPLEGLDVNYPDPKVLETRTGEAWPTKIEDSTAATQPIASDWLMGGWDAERKVVTLPNGGSGGHRLGGKNRSNNAVFTDSHVETRPFSKVQWQALSGDGKSAYLY